VFRLSKISSPLERIWSHPRIVPNITRITFSEIQPVLEGVPSVFDEMRSRIVRTSDEGVLNEDAMLIWHATTTVLKEQ
jgi:hypothetical protein